MKNEDTKVTQAGKIVKRDSSNSRNKTSSSVSNIRSKPVVASQKVKKSTDAEPKVKNALQTEGSKSRSNVAKTGTVKATISSKTPNVSNVQQSRVPKASDPSNRTRSKILSEAKTTNKTVTNIKTSTKVESKVPTRQRDEAKTKVVAKVVTSSRNKDKIEMQIKSDGKMKQSVPTSKVTNNTKDTKRTVESKTTKPSMSSKPSKSDKVKSSYTSKTSSVITNKPVPSSLRENRSTSIKITTDERTNIVIEDKEITPEKGVVLDDVVTISSKYTLIFFL